MFETLKKIGVPTAIAVAIVVMVMAIPFLFKIDERYAKHTHLEAEVLRLEKRNQELTVELAQNAGFQSAMIALIQQGRIPMQPPPIAVIAPDSEERPRLRMAPPPPRAVEQPADAAASAPSVILEKPRTWNEIGAAVTRQQQRLLKD